MDKWASARTILHFFEKCIYYRSDLGHLQFGIEVVDQATLSPMVPLHVSRFGSSFEVFSKYVKKIINYKDMLVVWENRHNLVVKKEDIDRVSTRRRRRLPVVVERDTMERTRMSPVANERMEMGDEVTMERMSMSPVANEGEKRGEEDIPYTYALKQKLTDRRKKHKVRNTKTVGGASYNMYIHDFLPEMQEYIQYIVDVPKDGHCGFRVLARYLGYSNKEGRTDYERDVLGIDVSSFLLCRYIQ